MRGPGAGIGPGRTTDYEALVGPRRFTLFDVSAISGAAFSPLMGSATQQAYRILFTATDLRLGVWLPHPAVVDAAARELDRQESRPTEPTVVARARAAAVVHGAPSSLAARGREARRDAEARLWAYVLRLRRDEPGPEQFFGGLLYHALQPTLGMLYAEAAGHTSYRSTWMCVTDGGHYDNLGLVEALQRAPELGITHILVLDASGDKADTWFTLGGSIALARSDAETEIVLNPTKMITPARRRADAELAQGQVVRPWASGTFTGQDAAAGQARYWCASSAGGRARHGTCGPMRRVIRTTRRTPPWNSFTTARSSTPTVSWERLRSSWPSRTVSWLQKVTRRKREAASTVPGAGAGIVVARFVALRVAGRPRTPDRGRARRGLLFPLLNVASCMSC